MYFKLANVGGGLVSAPKLELFMNFLPSSIILVGAVICCMNDVYTTPK